MFLDVRQEETITSIKSLSPRLHAVKGSPSNRPSPGSTNGDLLLTVRTSPDTSVKQPTQQFAAICSHFPLYYRTRSRTSYQCCIPHRRLHVTDVIGCPKQILHVAVEKRKAGGNAEQMRLLILKWFYCSTKLFHRNPASLLSHKHGGHTAAPRGWSEEFAPLLYHSSPARMRHSCAPVTGFTAAVPFMELG